VPTMPDTVKLISAEGFVFQVDRKAACVSNTIKNMLTSQGAERKQELELIGCPLPTPMETPPTPRRSRVAPRPGWPLP